MNRLFWDIETSPNIGFFWRSGYKLSIGPDNIIQERGIICICYKWQGEDEIHSIQWDDGDDRRLVQTFAVISGQADELVAHNGDKFDLKWFNGRNVMHGLDPLPDYKTFDTLAWSRRMFNFNSHKLDYLADIFLGRKKIKTDFSLWKNIVLYNDKQAMKDMIKYCKRDVELLEGVYDEILPYCKVKTHAGVAEGLGRWTCPICASENVYTSKTRYTTMGMLQHQMLCKDCHKYFTISDLVHRQYKESKM